MSPVLIQSAGRLEEEGREAALREMKASHWPLLVLKGRSGLHLSMLNAPWAARSSGRGGQKAGKRKPVLLERLLVPCSGGGIIPGTMVPAQRYPPSEEAAVF